LSDLTTLLEKMRGDDEQGAELAALMLAQAGEAALPELESMLESARADHRWWAVRTLAAMPEPRMEWLRRSLTDADPDVRAAASLAFVAHPDPDAAALLISVAGDEDHVAAAVATSALVALGEAAVSSLLDAFEEAGPRARIQILRALAEIRDPRAIRLLMKVMDEGSAAMQYWARQGLDLLGLDMIYMSPE
jgi:HEAT repeat protein